MTITADKNVTVHSLKDNNIFCRVSLILILEEFNFISKKKDASFEICFRIFTQGNGSLDFGR